MTARVLSRLRRPPFGRTARRASGMAARLTLALSVSLALPAAARDAASAPTQAPAARGEGPVEASETAPPAPPSPPSVTTGRRRVAPRLPAPKAGELEAYRILQEEAHEFERGAKDFQRLLTQVVRHHYEERRRMVFSSLDREIETEKQGLDAAREEAIRRSEAFIARYSGANADPEATPDAMFRLAALYDERARLRDDADLGKGLVPVIDLYRRIVREYPNYEELAAVHYYLGHALIDAGRLDECQQAWRALVCRERYRVEDDPKDASRIAVQALPQDHDDRYWTDWHNRHPIPEDQAFQKARKSARGLAGKHDRSVERSAEGGRRDPEDGDSTFSDPYVGCEPVPQKTLPGDEPRYVAEAWWQLGNYHFDQVDPRGGPFSLNRAASAYERSLEYKKPPIYGVSLYKLAWTNFKQQRYRTAVDRFTKLLFYADEEEKRTGDPGADFRVEAYTYVAGSLTYVDLDGPPAAHPYVARADVLDTETDPAEAERKMSIAIERVQDPALIPQDQKWTVEIYKALAQEFIEITQNHNAVAVLELTLEKFPLDRDAPVMQDRISRLYDQLAQLAPEGSASRLEYASKALNARTRLAQYVGATAWVKANRDDPEALTRAEQLVRGGLKRAAADHTNFARAYYDRALEQSEESEQRQLFEKAMGEYRFAELGWAGYVEQDPTSLDAYESRFWLADARYWVVLLEVTLGRTPNPEDVHRAREAAILVRDSNEDDRYLPQAAFYLVAISEKVLEDQYRVFAETGGQQGIERRSEVRFEGDAGARRVAKDEPPALVRVGVEARDDYVARVPVERDPEKNGLLYAFQSADAYFLYGQFAEARRRFTPLYEAYCGKNEWGYKAWEKLVSMSNFEGDAAQSRKLAEGKSCAYDEESEKAEASIRQPVKRGLAYLDARKLYEAAEQMPDGPERVQKWRETAAAYRVALDADPDRDEAPEAAMNGAYAYKQVGEYDEAIEMYELFISRYGSEASLKRLQAGDPRAKPPIAPNPQKYEERAGYLKNAYDALGASYVLFFDYPRAAQTYDKIASTQHFEAGQRREAARQALTLYASLGDRGGLRRSHERFQKLGASEEESAEADFIVASESLRRWDRYGPDKGENAAARASARRAMEEYHKANRNRAAAGKQVVEAAYWSALLQDRGMQWVWWQNTISAFDRWQATESVAAAGPAAVQGTRHAGLAAEAEYRLLDAELVRKFDYETGYHRYKGTVVEVMKKYRAEVVEAKAWDDRLQQIIDRYASPEWTAAALARQGTVWDSVRTGLYNTRPPELKMFDAKQEALLRKAEASDNPDLQAQADAVRVSVQKGWRDSREKELNGADEVMVDRYAKAVVVARRFSISSPAVQRAVRRLAFFTDVIGEAKLRQYVFGVKGLEYAEGMFPRMRSGDVVAPPPDGTVAPLPALVE